MTTLVANIAVDMSQIGTQIQQFFQAVDLAQDSSTTLSAKYHSTSLNMSVEFAGVNITYVNAGPLQAINGGTISSFEVDTPIGTLGYKFSGYSSTFPNFIDLAGADTLNGSPFADTLGGSTGTDTLRGGKGKDLLSGGTDTDIFDFNSALDSRKGAARDVIGDFSGHVTGGELDLIDLAGIDAKKGAGNQAFKFIGAQKFHDKAGELQVKYNAATDTAIVSGDVNGDGKADFQIEVLSLNALVKADFIL